MRNTIVEDRILARVARDAVGWDDGAAPAERADIAVGRAVVALRVLGIGVTAEVTQALRDDVSLLLSDTARTGPVRTPFTAALGVAA
ncbi:MAG: hypothetical protein ACRYGP_29490 [Janthinobacterium lividum]